MPTIRFAPGVDASRVSAPSTAVLLAALTASGNASATVTSVTRSPADQARIMFENCERHGAQSQYKLYGPVGDHVIAVYEECKSRGLSGQDAKAAMLAKIIEIDPYLVSHHCGDPALLNVIDLAPSTVAHPHALIVALKADARVRKVMSPEDPLHPDPAIHAEIPQLVEAARLAEVA